MKKFFPLMSLIGILSIFTLTGCADTDSPTDNVVDIFAEETLEDTPVVFSLPGVFYDDIMDLELTAAEGSTIYYTTDGTTPSTSSKLYSDPIRLGCSRDDFPKNQVIRAIAVDENGEASEVVNHNYFISTNINGRFTTPIFSIWGNPDDLWGKPDGIMYEENLKAHGKDYEKEVFVHAIDTNGKTIFAQNLGIRLYGGYSRMASIKSFKLIAREEYGKKKMSLNLFNTPDSEGNSIDKYDRLVLRNGGNDLQFAFIRDEFNQTMAKKAGLMDYEGVVPVVVYLNGEYYGFHWLHENYCDDYFKSKYGDGEGEFVILEGKETEKDEDEEKQDIVDDFNNTYNELIELDLTNDANFAKVKDFIDVENYLDYYAFNIYVNNKDWPQNNMKVYRYYPADGEETKDGAFDGRWRFLPHDMDYSYSLYQQSDVLPTFDTLYYIKKPGHERYSPLFTALMERSDMKEYFDNKMISLSQTVFEPEAWAKSFDELHESRMTEMGYYYKHLEKLKKAGDKEIWTFPGRMTEDVKDIKTFINRRFEFINL